MSLPAFQNLVYGPNTDVELTCPAPGAVLNADDTVDYTAAEDMTGDRFSFTVEPFDGGTAVVTKTTEDTITFAHSGKALTIPWATDSLTGGASYRYFIRAVDSGSREVLARGYVEIEAM